MNQSASGAKRKFQQGYEPAENVVGHRYWRKIHTGEINTPSTYQDGEFRHDFHPEDAQDVPQHATSAVLPNLQTPVIQHQSLFTPRQKVLIFYAVAAAVVLVSSALILRWIFG